MKRLIRKLLLSILSIALSAVMLGTVTYAWITMTNKNFLDGLVLNVSSGAKLEVSLDGVTYYNKLPTEIISEHFSGLKICDVTSFDGLNFSAGGPLVFREAVPNVDYISLTIWIRSTGTERNVFLVDNVSELVQYDIDLDGTYVISRGVDWKADKTFINGINAIEDIVHEGENDVYYASDAVRIAFLEQINENNPLDSRSPDSLQKVIIDLSGNPLRGYGVPYGALDYASRRIGLEIQAPLEKPAVVNELTEFTSQYSSEPLDENSKIMELIGSAEKDNSGKTFYTGKVIVNIWVEGWDADCFDAILDDMIRMQLKFRTGKSITL